MKSFAPESGAETRIIRYRSNTERFTGTLKSYDYKDPLQIVAAGVNVVTQGFGIDPLIKDAGRTIDGNTNELSPYEGIAPRTRGNIGETLGDIVQLKPFSALTKVINIPGDAIADAADALSGRFHDQRLSVRNNIQQTLAA